MGKVQEVFSNNWPGSVSRSVDDIIISVKNASESDIPFGAPVFMTTNGAVPFNVSSPQEFATFLGFTVRVADKTPDTYSARQFDSAPEGTWHAGDVMEVLVRGGMIVPIAANGTKGGKLYLRKSDGKLTPDAGSSGTTVELSNVRIRNPRNSYTNCAEVIVNERNLI